MAAGSNAVNGKLTAIEGGRRRKLASMTQRLFAAGASRPPTSANRWASMVILRGTMYVLRCYLQPDCHMAGVPVSMPVTILYLHYHQSQPSSQKGLTNHLGAYKSP